MEASVKRLASIISCWVIFLLMSPQSRAADLDGLVSSLKDGGYVIVFRHGATDDSQKDVYPFKFDDMKVHVYGNVAVVTGRNTIKGVWEDIEHDISGPYRFTDVFVKRDGRWQCVASQSSRIDLKK